MKTTPDHEESTLKANKYRFNKFQFLKLEAHSGFIGTKLNLHITILLFSK